MFPIPALFPPPNQWYWNPTKAVTRPKRRKNRANEILRPVSALEPGSYVPRLEKGQTIYSVKKDKQNKKRCKAKGEKKKKAPTPGCVARQ